jgi:uncharacterized protein (DUF362 family)/Pyruvate/2-oxoacid:ferredoxin oxidoreductase delta subunit
MSVYFTLCPDYQPQNVDGALERLLTPWGGMEAFIRPGQKVLIKPNLLSAEAVERRVTTDPALVRAVASAALRAGGIVSIGDSPALEGFNRVGERSGMSALARELGVELVELSQPVRAQVPAGGKFKSLELARQALEAEVIINLPKLKTHNQMALTLGVKNLFGTVVAQRKAQWHHQAGHDVITFASLLLDIWRTLRPALTILDGVWGMEGPGPANGRPRSFGLLAAAANPLHLDLHLALKLGLGWQRYPLAQAAAAMKLIPQPFPRAVWLGEEAPAHIWAGVDIPIQRGLGFLPPFLERLTRRYVVSRPTQDRRRCLLCGKCLQICPEQCIKALGKILKFDYYKCIRCYCCQEVCPAGAINLRMGWLEKLLKILGR